MSDATAAFFLGSDPLSPSRAEELALEHFGVRGTAVPVHGERDRNFHLQVPGSPGYLLKLHPPGERPDVVDLQVRVLRHLSQSPVPRVIPSITGDDTLLVSLGGPLQHLRLLTWLEGTPYGDLDPLTPAQLRTFGAALAELDVALQTFVHSADHALLWDLQRPDRLVPLMDHVPAEVRGLARETLRRHEVEVAPTLSRLPRQVIHNDANPGNVLFHEGNVAFIDFGDMVRGTRVQELAVAGAYLDRPEEPMLAPFAELVAGYDVRSPLSPGELKLLPGLLRTRALLSLVISHWAATFSHEAEELETVFDRAARRLRRFWEIEAEGGDERLRTAVEATR